MSRELPALALSKSGIRVETEVSSQLCSSPVLLFIVRSAFGDECHEDEIACWLAVLDAVSFTVGAEGSSTGVELHFPAVVAIEGFSLQYMVAFGIAVMFVIAYGAAWRYGDFSVHIAFAV